MQRLGWQRRVEPQWFGRGGFWLGLAGILLWAGGPAQAQSIQAAPNATGTIVNQVGPTYTITGGIQVPGNVLHRLLTFGLNQGEIATFLSSPTVANIVVEVQGGEVSTINGLIQVTGGPSNLFLLNPAGVVFGPSGSLNVPAAFFAVPGIGGNGGDIGRGLPAAELQNPDLPDVLPALALPSSLSLDLTKVSTGLTATLTPLPAADGIWPWPHQFAIAPDVADFPTIQPIIMAAYGQTEGHWTQNSSLLRLDLQPLAEPYQPLDWPLSAIEVPQRLTGGKAGNAHELIAHADGRLQLVGSGITARPTVATAAATVPTSGLQPAQPDDPQPADDRLLPAPQTVGNPARTDLACVDSGVLAIEAQLSQTYGHRAMAVDRGLNPCHVLSTIQATTGVRPALLYATFAPTSLSGPQANDPLEVILVTNQGPPIRRRIPAATRHTILQVASTLRAEISDPSKTDSDSYKVAAHQLYQWLIAPIEAELAAQDIKTLTFILDAQLSALPVAALYDRSQQQFLIQKYSLGLMPNLSLTDTRYRNIRQVQVLAMGRSAFTDPKQPPLPAVPVELALITERLWRGTQFLNQHFTLSNLKAQRQQNRYGIIHLATHGEFKSAIAPPSQMAAFNRLSPAVPQAQPVSNGHQSYIQLWDSQLRLDQLRELKLEDPPVELMVFSACRTALGDPMSELGFAGLAVQAGVKSALASLWYVSDAGTLGLVTEFYQQLKQAPIKAEALRQAQLAMLNRQVAIRNGTLVWTGGTQPLPSTLPEQADLSHPYYWAGFTLVGSPW